MKTDGLYIIIPKVNSIIMGVSLGAHVKINKEYGHLDCIKWTQKRDIWNFF